MGFSVNWHSFANTPDGDGNFTITNSELNLLDFGAQYGDDSNRIHPTKHVVGLRFQGTSAFNIRVWLASTFGEIIPDTTKRPLPRINVEVVSGSPLRHERHLLEGEVSTFSAVRDDNSGDASIDPYKIVFNGSILVSPALWNPSVMADSPGSVGAKITLTPPHNIATGTGIVWVRDQDTDAIYSADFEVVDALFRFYGCRATDQTTYNGFVPTWSVMPQSEPSAVSLLDAPLNKQFEAYSQPLGIGVVVPHLVNPAYANLTIQNLRLMAAFDTYDQPE